MSVHRKKFAVAASFNNECLWLVKAFTVGLRTTKPQKFFPLECFAVYGKLKS